MKTKPQEIKQGDHVLITDRQSKFKTKYGVVKKVQTRGYVVTVDDNGKPRDIKTSKKGVLFSEKGKEKSSGKSAKFKEGDLVYSWQNQEEARPVSFVRFEPWLKDGKPHENDQWKYKVSLIDKEGYTRSSKWMGEESLSKEKENSEENNSEKELNSLQTQIDTIEKEITTLEEKRDALQEQKTKIIAKEILDGKRDHTGTPFMPWQKELTDDEVQFIIAAVNRYGSGDHPKATKENWRSFKFDYIKNVLQKIDVKEHLGEQGATVLKACCKNLICKC